VKDDRVYLLHISECIADIEEFTSQGEHEFFNDKRTQLAVLRSLQTLAESSQRLSAASKDSRPEVNWRKIAGFRNILVHGYLALNLNLVWQIMRRDLPVLKSAVAAMLERRL